MRKALATIPLFLIALTLIVFIFASSLSSTQIHNVGQVKAVNVGVFSDAACTQNLTNINWGMLDPSSSKNVTIWLKSTSDVPVTLSMTTTNWQPVNASNYISCTWDAQGKTLQVNGTAQAILTLSVASTIHGITNFAFDITITGSG